LADTNFTNVHELEYKDLMINVLCSSEKPEPGALTKNEAVLPGFLRRWTGPGSGAQKPRLKMPTPQANGVAGMAVSRYGNSTNSLRLRC
jgi:hypothetical protein